ncbi:hypothetical protein APHAL10511_003579 [Amanita phalloides]|nr:hypothetical protein APHAL10511_003579 [Amanita phalloides]
MPGIRSNQVNDPTTLVGVLMDNFALPTPPIDPRALVYYTDIFLASVIAFIIILRLPRGLARFWKTYEWCNGHFLSYTPPRQRATVSRRPSQGQPARQPSTSRRGRSPGAEKGYAATDESHTLYSHTATRLNHKGQRMQPSYPPHFASCPAFLRRVVGLLSVSNVPGYSNLQLLIMLAYSGVLVFALLYRSNFFTNQRRAGWVAVSQLPFLLAFIAKNNVLGWLMGIEYQKFNYLHRYLGRMIVLGANIHAFGYFYRWAINKTILVQLSVYSNIWGLVCLISVDLILIFSTTLWRTKAYNIFQTTHFIGFAILVPALYQHNKPILPFIIALLVPYGFDYLFRFLKTRFVTATIRPLPSLSATRIEVPSLNSGWRPGQHVRVRIFSSALGWLGWTESHPFTIASAPVISSKHGRAVGEEGLVLICKKTGGWTGRLFDMAKRSGYIEAGIAEGVDIGKTVGIMIEGPYSGPGHAIYASYSAVVMLIGGSGITFALSILQDLVQKDQQAQSRVKVLELIWMVQNPDAMTPLLPLFTALVESCPALSISVHYTRAYAPRTAGKTSKGSKEDPRGRTPSGNSESLFPMIPQGLPISLSAGRPSQAALTKVIENAINQTVSIGSGAMGHEDERGINGVMVGICGPTGLGREAIAAVNSIDIARKNQAGGVEVHEEMFGY